MHALRLLQIKVDNGENNYVNQEKRDNPCILQSACKQMDVA